MFGTFSMLLLSAFLAQAGQQKTVWDGVYATPQATSGQAIYTEYCATCHGTTLTGGASQGAPPLRGDKFMENWREDNLESLFTKIRTTMPRRDPKNLSETETLDLVAYILQSNEFPTGSDLSTDALRSIQIQRKDGPRPLPNYAIVQIVGCMTQEGDAWTLTMAAQPKRLRSSDKATPEELKAAESTPLGTATFRLQNLAMLGAFDPAAHNNHKMLAKGPLIRQSNSERISVTELEMVGTACK
ncbi:MAG: cytochrome c [Acidobacteria bacterium]|nr:cytochrome c [Acidobacteriota bacterium]